MFKIGDEVVDGYGNIGVVTNLSESRSPYPLEVKFSTPERSFFRAYTEEGLSVLGQASKCCISLVNTEDRGRALISSQEAWDLVKAFNEVLLLEISDKIRKEAETGGNKIEIVLKPASVGKVHTWLINSGFRVNVLESLADLKHVEIYW